MAKPISWLKDAPAIRSQVASSNYSHFHTSDIGRLFGLMPRAASSLMEAMPRVRYGTSYIVPAEGLADFLDDVIQTTLAGRDVPALIQARRGANLYVSRRKPRTVVLKDELGRGLASLPDCVTLTRGELRIKFETALELGKALAILASNMDGDWEWYEFCRLYEPEQPALPSESAYEAVRLGSEAKYFVERGDAGKAGDHAREAFHHAHWVQVERGTVTLAEYDKEMEAIESVAGGMKEIRSALTAGTGLVAFSDLSSRCTSPMAGSGSSGQRPQPWGAPSLGS
jgi:hypothetical protein